MADTGLGYRGNPLWRDMSEFLVHFVTAAGDASAHDVLLQILQGGWIEARRNPFGRCRSLGALAQTQNCVCQEPP